MKLSAETHRLLIHFNNVINAKSGQFDYIPLFLKTVRTQNRPLGRTSEHHNNSCQRNSSLVLIFHFVFLTGF